MPIDYQFFDLAGTHYDLGRAQGARTERFGIPAWWPAPAPLAFARACAQQIAEIHAPLLDELHGYADAQGLEFDDVLRGVCRQSMRVRARGEPAARLQTPTYPIGANLSAGGLPDLTPPAPLPSKEGGRKIVYTEGSALALHGRNPLHPGHATGDCAESASIPTYPEGGCSSFAVVGADGHVRAGRNYDFHTVQQVRQRLRLRPANGRPSLGMRGSVPGGRYDGVNDAGLFICLHVALSDEPAQPRPGVPFHLLPRLALETCASTAQAVDLLTRVRHLHPFNYLIADAGGDLAVVEAHPEAARVTQRGDDFVAATNHYRHPDLVRFQRGRKLTHSQGRLASLFARRQQLREAGDITPALADHDSGLCGHSGGHTTLWSLQADLTARTIRYARGAPCETKFEEVAWPI